MELRHLRSFRVVAEESNVTKAAKRLNIAQPALTQQMKALESHLGVNLLNRLGRGVEVTPAGRCLQAGIEKLLEFVKATEEKAREIERRYSRTMRIGFAEGEAPSASSTTLIAKYRLKYPDVIVRERLIPKGDIGSALREGRIDAAFCHAAIPNAHRLSSCPIESLTALVAIPSSDSRAQQNDISLESIGNVPLVIVSHADPYSLATRFRELCAQSGHQPAICEVTPKVLFALNRVVSGAAFALVPANVAGLHSRSVRFLKLTNFPTLATDVYLYVRRGTRSPDIEALYESCALPHELKH